MLDFEGIQQILPHRFPFLLLDRAIDISPGVSATAVRAVSGNEWFFQGHFPGYAVMPGVLILEAMAQTGALALYKVMMPVRWPSWRESTRPGSTGRCGRVTSSPLRFT